jgi:hypothetical protein
MAPWRSSPFPSGKKAGHDLVGQPTDPGQRVLELTGTKLIGRLAALIPPPRANQIRFHGVYAPASKMRKHVIPKRAKELCSHNPKKKIDAKTKAAILGPRAKQPNGPLPGPYRIPWADLLKRTFGIDLLVCSKCGGKRKVIATIKDGPTARKILKHLGLPSAPLKCSPARGPPQPDFFEAA